MPKPSRVGVTSNNCSANTSNESGSLNNCKHATQPNLEEPFPNVGEDSKSPPIEYSFPLLLTTRTLRKLPARSVHALVSEQCFIVPPRPLLDHFMVNYFLHVHPLLPMLDECAFWDGYFGVGPVKDMSFSLFLFQAMLFASSKVGPAPPPWVRRSGIGNSTRRNSLCPQKSSRRWGLKAPPMRSRRFTRKQRYGRGAQRQMKQF